ncbi:hypothetical protein SDRG_06712 [Saprolegnia diclina VS20]|uniref:H/ACA ribonucleoprotein complex non-core subunit NAF1 n=1 Tax=Saprolegnia diclina (strain VS20) TaxID=1156394 RepID=T0QQ61_SAPDV|nr:hypothetical protein SDRG_06712 [Saprolegnia diclina VS20]EQC35970.1 hypothetical protein SDRG_06712 [Saprolegnia diclina VS20]|eukprot:XP_008610732.1 hypothetical protein SDRG_06712 [Saprolegnia diclina VS20]
MDVLVAASYAGVDVSDVVDPEIAPLLAPLAVAAVDVAMDLEDGEVADMEDVPPTPLTAPAPVLAPVVHAAELAAGAETAPSSPSSSSSDDASMADDSEPDDSDDEDTGKLRIEIEAALKRDEHTSLIAGPVATVHEVQKVPVKKADVQLTSDCPIDRMGYVLNINRAGPSITIQGHPHQAILDEGSVLCLQSRVVLGCVDEVFGQVKLPMYLIRFETPEDIPESVALQAAVFYTTQHATYVETSKLNIKGTDASNLYDEEVGAEEMEFSDDEAEAEARRKLKATKRKHNPDATPKVRPQQPHGGGRGPPGHPHQGPPGHTHHQGPPRPHFFPPQFPPHPHHPQFPPHQHHHAPPPGYFEPPPRGYFEQPPPGYGYPPQGGGYPPHHHQHPQGPPHHHHQGPPPHNMPPHHHPGPFPGPPGRPMHPDHPGPWHQQGPPPPYYQQFPPRPPQDDPYHYRN